jgi:hypothetical protein
MQIHTIDLFPKLDTLLLELLRNLKKEDWDKPTVAPLWKVKDVAAHLLDGNIRGLSTSRDDYFGEKPSNIHSYTDLVSFLNGLNVDWVKAFQRVSPQMLIELLEITGKQYYEHLKSLNPDDKAIYSVAWAGEEQSANWFHIAREYTEKWHHQQQIRWAVGKEDVLLQKEFYEPFLETSMRALPHHYRTIKGEDNETILFQIKGDVDGDVNLKWFLEYQNQQPLLKKSTENQPICTVNIDSQIAWRIFTKGISIDEALNHSTIEGKADLGKPIFNLLAVMA